jgi:murein DD-endopeptidase MepM/ murein hydrolase activator NlpD
MARGFALTLRRPVPAYAPIICGFKEPKNVWYLYNEELGVWLNAKDGTGMGQNPGIDFDAPLGTSVCAVAPGIVIRAGFEFPTDGRKGLGMRISQMVSKLGKDSWIVTYGHLGSIATWIGRNLVEGEVLGTTGQTGETTAPVLHVRMTNLQGQFQPMEFSNAEPV